MGSIRWLGLNGIKCVYQSSLEGWVSRIGIFLTKLYLENGDGVFSMTGKAYGARFSMLNMGMSFGNLTLQVQLLVGGKIYGACVEIILSGLILVYYGGWEGEINSDFGRILGLETPY